MRPRRSPRCSDPNKIELAVALRRTQRLSYAQIAERVGISSSTVARACQHAGVARLPPLQDAAPVRRYEPQSAGVLLYLDTKKLARFDQPSHRVTGDSKPLHIRCRLAALRYDNALGVKVQRVMTDNGSAYKSRHLPKLLRRLKIKHLRTRPYTPKTNGKAERFIQTLLRERAWAYRYPTSEHRADELAPWMTTSIALTLLLSADLPLLASALTRTTC